MRITVFGANGRVGSRVVEEALRRGHIVRAFVHNHNTLPEHNRLEIIKGDIYVREDVEHALEGCQVIISALSSWGTKRKDVQTQAMLHIIPAAEAKGVHRVVSVTGSDARDTGDKPNLLQKALHSVIGVMAKKILADGEEHIRQLRASNLDWSVVRSPVMNSTGSVDYKLSSKQPGPFATVNRLSVALAMVELAETGQYSRQSPFIHRS